MLVFFTIGTKIYAKDGHNCPYLRRGRFGLRIFPCNQNVNQVEDVLCSRLAWVKGLLQNFIDKL
jgi:hypothetical protein